MMNILITGASGFIGTGLIRLLREEPNINLFALSRNKVKSNYSEVKFVQGDILDSGIIESLFAQTKFDAVIHLAAITAHSEIVDNRFKTFDINLKGTENLLKAFNKYCNKAVFFYASTGKVYGKTNEMPITERAFANPMNVLGKTKYITEKVIDFYAQPQNKYVIGRIFNVYGEYQKDNFIVPTILKQLDNEKLILGNLTDKRDYIYIEDLLHAIKACILKKEKCSNVEYINIGSGIPVSVEDILQEIESIIGKKLFVISDKEKFRMDETSVEYCDNTKLRELMGWSQSYSLHDGLEKVIDWHLKKDRNL